MASKLSGSPGRRRGKRKRAPSHGFGDWQFGNEANVVHSVESVEISDEDAAGPSSENGFADRDDNVAHQSVPTFSDDEYLPYPFASKSDERNYDAATSSSYDAHENANEAVVVVVPNDEKVEVFPVDSAVRETSTIVDTSEERKNFVLDLNSCGICLLDDVEDRGILDSCEHLFCFSCIMEWSKVESRCPMCKRRFSEVKRREDEQLSSLTNDGKAQVYQVPLKDQTYEPTEEEINDALELYRGVACMMCAGQSHEELLLLCDSCDSAAHTFCVGLDHTVPEGDWLCPSCTGEDIFVTPIEAPQSQSRPTTSASRGRRELGGSVRSRLESRLSAVRAARSRHVRQRRVTDSASRASRPTLMIEPPQRGNARSVNSVNEELQHLRENWEDLRRGHLDFPSGQLGSRESGASGLQQNTVSSSGRRLDSESSGLAEHVRSDEMSQIWRMLEQARALRNSTGRPNSSRSLSAAGFEQQSTPASLNVSAGGRGTSPTMPLFPSSRDREQNRRVSITRARHQLDWGGSTRAPRVSASRGDLPSNQLKTVGVLASSEIPKDHNSAHGYSRGGGTAVTNTESGKHETGTNSPKASSTEAQGKLVKISEKSESKNQLHVRKMCNHLSSEAALASTSVPTLEESQKNLILPSGDRRDALEGKPDSHISSSSQQFSLYKQEQSKVPKVHSENGILHGELSKGEHSTGEQRSPNKSNLFHKASSEVESREKRGNCVENDQRGNSLTSECHLVASDIDRKAMLLQPSVNLVSEEKNPKIVHSLPQVHTEASLAVRSTGPGTGLKEKGKKRVSWNGKMVENLRKEKVCAKNDSSNSILTLSEQKPEYCKEDMKDRNRLSVPLPESDILKAKAHKNAVAQKVKDHLQPTYSSGQIDREQFKAIAQLVTHSMMGVYKSGKCSHFLGKTTQQEICPKDICTHCLQHYVKSATSDVCGIVPPTL